MDVEVASVLLGNLENGCERTGALKMDEGVKGERPPDQAKLGVSTVKFGSRGDLVLWSCADHRHVPYHLGAHHVRTVLCGGEIAWTDEAEPAE